ncbi:MAG: rod shape-determining protein RodA [Caldithrix sp.]|nr:rod shape-determining protein RodA [Caldithrix sp.]
MRLSVKNILLNVDWVFVVLVSLLIITGTIAVYSATHTAGIATNVYFGKQILFAIAGMIIMLGVAFIPQAFIKRFAWLAYALSLLLLVMVSVMGNSGYGAERWLSFAGINIQPSELAKIATILAVARYVSLPRVRMDNAKHLLIVITIISVPLILIIQQPDLGTALVFIAIIVPILFWAGLNWFYILILMAPAITAVASFHKLALFMWIALLLLILFFARRTFWTSLGVLILHGFVGFITPFLWSQLKPYQQQRILTFLSPEADPYGAGYQIIQSKVAIGSGGLWGKGFLDGTQSQLKFLPAQHTDFIFSVIGEEWGFFGILAVLAVFLILLIYMVNLATLVRSAFASISIIGFGTILMFHIFVNVGMTVGLVPVTGLPLPFISYGGSFLLVTMLMMGLTLNFSINRYER